MVWLEKFENGRLPKIVRLPFDSEATKNYREEVKKTLSLPGCSCMRLNHDLALFNGFEEGKDNKSLIPCACPRNVVKIIGNVEQ